MLLNSSVSMVFMIGMIVINIISKLILARILTSHDLGLFLIIQTFLGMFTYLVSLNLGDAIARYISSYENEGDDILINALRLISIIFFIFTFIITLLFYNYQYYFTNELISNQLILIFILIILITPFKITANFIGSAYQGIGQLHKKLIYSEFLPAFIFITGLIVLQYITDMSLLKVLLLYLLPFAIVPYIYVGKFKFRFFYVSKILNYLIIQKLLKFSLPLFMAGILAWPLNCVPIIIGFITSPEDVSHYCLALSIVSCIYLSVSAVDMAGLTQWTKHINQNRKNDLIKEYRSATRWSILFASFLFTVCFICPKDLTNILFGGKYMSIDKILPALAFIVFANVLTGPSESILKAHEDTRYIFITRLTVALTTMISIYPALKFWGLNGAIFVFGLSTLCSVFMYSLRLYIKFELFPFDKFYTRMFCSIICSMGLVVIIEEYIQYEIIFMNLLLKLIMYIFFLSIFVYLFKVTPYEEKQLIKYFFIKLKLLRKPLNEN